MKKINTGLKTLIIDLETTPNIGASFGGRWEVNIVWFLKETELLSFSWKWHGEKNTYVKSLRNYKNRKKSQLLLVKDLHKIMSEADIIVAHNGKSFDFKMANRFFLKEGLKPIQDYKQVDTKLMCKSVFKFTSNKLDDVANYLGLGRKLNTGGFELWKGCLEWDKKSFDLMEKYNKQDVILLEKVYDKLLPWCKHPIVYTEKNGCRICGGNHMEQRGWSYLDGGKSKKKKMVCLDCGKWNLGELIKI